MYVEEKKALLDKCMFSEIWLDSIDEQSIEKLIEQKIIKRIIDENGEVYECRIKPYRNSDKMLINMILR